LLGERPVSPAKLYSFTIGAAPSKGGESVQFLV
jgi:hypothetical protein